MSYLRSSAFRSMRVFSQTRCAQPDIQTISQITGNPISRLTRTAVISYVGKAPNQNGVGKTEKWQVTFTSESRYDNDVMGWKSSSDPLGRQRLTFTTRKAAEDYCNNLGMQTHVTRPDAAQTGSRPTAESNYSMNFAYRKPKSSPFDDDE